MSARRLRVLWFCNRPLSDVDAGVTGTWLDAMAGGLLAGRDFELGVVAPHRRPKVLRQDCGTAAQWLVPVPWRMGRHGMPSAALVGRVVEIVRAFSPDLIHIWGSESFWGLLTARGHVAGVPALLTMQGVKYRVGQHFLADLTWRERLAATGPKEVIRGLVTGGVRRSFSRWKPFEFEVIRGHRWVCYQTAWQASHVRAAGHRGATYQLDLPLRDAFAAAERWSAERARGPSLLCISSYPSPAKGLHVAVRALAQLRVRFPALRMRIAGPGPGRGLLADGYLRWLDRQVRRLGMGGQVQWLGPLHAEALRDELLRASVVVLPAFVESYGLALAEAMCVGTPAVVSYTGGTSHLGRNESTCLMIPPGDVASCAAQIERLLSDPGLAERLSRQARLEAVARHDRARIAHRQAEIYHDVLAQANRQTAPVLR